MGWWGRGGGVWDVRFSYGACDMVPSVGLVSCLPLANRKPPRCSTVTAAGTKASRLRCNLHTVITQAEPTYMYVFHSRSMRWMNESSDGEQGERKSERSSPGKR